jgi:hypothetical protein
VFARIEQGFAVMAGSRGAFYLENDLVTDTEQTGGLFLDNMAPTRFVTAETDDTLFTPYYSNFSETPASFFTSGTTGSAFTEGTQDLLPNGDPAVDWGTTELAYIGMEGVDQFGTMPVS